jgi:carbonic anhydrase/acetyltransferase-like protein (isoleucine patch superfamily)
MANAHAQRPTAHKRESLIRHCEILEFPPYAAVMPIYALGEREPTIDTSAYVHPDAVIIGAVVIGARSSIWPTAVLRGDHGRILIGEMTSIQDGTVIHCTAREDTLIGSRCVVGHNAHLEGCVVGDDCLIGSGSVVLNGAQVLSGAMVAAGALVTGGTVVPTRARAMGVPARIVPDAIAEGAFTESVQAYVHSAQRYAAELKRLQ